jgi:type IV pilus assembly protein PilW
VLLADKGGAGATTVPCMLTQVSASFSNAVSSGSTPAPVTALPLAGAWYAATVGTQSVTSYPLNTGVAIDLGSPTSVRPPSFQLLGVGDNNTLYSYDLLNIASTPLQPRAEGVFEMHALYGVGTTFYAADATSIYSVAALSAGNSTSAALIAGINAIRIGLILRTALPEKNVVAGPRSLTLFPDLAANGLSFTRTLTADEQHYRYRTIEATIPMRNSF